VRRFHFEVDPSIAGQPADAVFSPANIGRTVAFEEATIKEDAFDANRKVYAGYLMGDVARWEPLRVIVGARYEVSPLALTLGNGLGIAPANAMHLRRTDSALLPAAGLVLAVSRRSNARAAYGVTVARPHLRELSPTPFFDYVRRRVVSGDPTLQQTRIHNADLRWETFLSGSEVVAGSVFFKYFDKPIERTVISAGDGQNLGFANAASATTYGLELEARLLGSRLSPRLEAFYLGANFSYIASQVKTQGSAGSTSRALEGQSPYVGNLEVGFRRAGTHLSLLYNVFGRRIVEVGTGGSGNVYEQPVHRLDLSFSQQLGHRLSLKLSGTNLLDQKTRFVQDGIDIYSYQPGVAAFATIEWVFEGASK
jgi:outer membrane receptor protein involved in Fe transport